MTARAVRAKASGALTGDQFLTLNPAYFGTGDVAKQNDDVGRPARPPNFFWTPARRIWIDKGAMNTGQ